MLAYKKVLANLQKGFNKLTEKVLIKQLNMSCLDFFSPWVWGRKFFYYFIFKFLLDQWEASCQQILLEVRLIFLGKFSEGIAFSHTSQLPTQTSRFPPSSSFFVVFFYLPL